MTRVCVEFGTDTREANTSGKRQKGRLLANADILSTAKCQLINLPAGQYTYKTIIFIYLQKKLAKRSSKNLRHQKW